MKLTNKLLLVIILTAAVALRVYNYFEIPFTHDEFSALFRLNFTNFSDLIEKGVKIDGHPAGVHVFLYYWVKLFGSSEWVVKAPFTVFGILSVWLIYLIAKDWYNETVALIAASFLASIQYTVMYSQIARPYSSGLFFSLLMVYFWTKIVLSPKKRFYLNSFFFILSASLCSYNHHFSLLFVVIVGLSGLFLIEKDYLLKYIGSGILIFVFYIPHIPIFLYQLNVGGVEGWLAKPEKDFILDYLGFIFQYSYLSLLLVFSLILLGFYRIKDSDFNYKHLLLFSCWFMLPFLIGFIYSIYRNSVLQFSVLIFSFPFLFFVLFGHIKQQTVKMNFIIVLSILSLNIYSLIKNRQYYDLMYHSAYKQILTDCKKVQDSKGGNVISIVDSHKEITRYYNSKYNLDTNFIWFDSFSNEKAFREYIDKKSKLSDYLYFGSMSGVNPAMVPIIQDYFPTIEEQGNYFIGTTYLFSKKKQKGTLIDSLTFEKASGKFWSLVDANKIVDTGSYSGKFSYKLDKETEWSPIYTRALQDIIVNENNFIDISVKAKVPEKIHEIVLVASLESRGKTIYWSGTPFDKFIPTDSVKNEWITIHHSLKLSDVYQNYPDILLKVYIWNKDKQNFVLDNFKIKLRQGNPVIYGLVEKI